MTWGCARWKPEKVSSEVLTEASLDPQSVATPTTEGAAIMTTTTASQISQHISDQLARSFTRPAWARRADMADMLKAYTVPELVAFLAAQGIAWNATPRRVG